MWTEECRPVLVVVLDQNGVLWGGYSTEYEISRVLCDARILSIFEGAAEIQAQVIARGLLGRLN